MTGQNSPSVGHSLIASQWRPPTVLALVMLVALHSGRAQTAAPTSPYERNYVQPKSTVEKALRQLQPALGGRLPVLDGFAVEGDRPLNRYQRAYYQSIVKVNSTPSGGSVVRVSTKVTAWYADSNASRAGYQLLTSNGRLENDLLDQLTDLLASAPNAPSTTRDSGGSSGLDFPATAHSAAEGIKQRTRGRTRARESPTKKSRTRALLSRLFPRPCPGRRRRSAPSVRRPAQRHSPPYRARS